VKKRPSKGARCRRDHDPPDKLARNALFQIDPEIDAMCHEQTSRPQGVQTLFFRFFLCGGMAT
jgi:hypothetical protein